MSDSSQDYKSILTDIIKKQIIILGPAITLAKVRQVKGLTISEDGTVTGISDTQDSISKQLIEQFTELSSPIVKKTMAPLMQQIQIPASPPPPVDEEDKSEVTEAHPSEETIVKETTEKKG